MARVYFPGCKIKAKYPEASRRMAELVVERGYADEVAGCCRVNHQRLEPSDTAVALCCNCMAMIDEDGANGQLDYLYAQAAMREHAAGIPTELVACYCTGCHAGLEMGGKRAVNVLELVSGTAAV